ncbi:MULTISPECIES: hypothetical protein [unclassified Rhizobium]|uniref:hypothetical protein n=1 Tax=unclassified Rhizobium TaxID=2613769 RepID=UPI0012E38983|nr:MULTISPECIES: hypothetical protein [unclassified Rhizobium]
MALAGCGCSRDDDAFRFPKEILALAGREIADDRDEAITVGKLAERLLSRAMRPARETPALMDRAAAYHRNSRDGAAIDRHPADA